MPLRAHLRLSSTRLLSGPTHPYSPTNSDGEDAHDASQATHSTQQIHAKRELIRDALPHTMQQNFASSTNPAPLLPSTEETLALTLEDDYAESKMDADAFMMTAGPTVEHDLPGGLVLDLENEEMLLDYLPLASDPDAAWQVYDFLSRNGCRVPTRILRKLLILIGRAAPTRSQFLRLLSIINTLRERDRFVFVNEWNYVIAAAGRGQRGHKMDNYRAALGVYQEMLNYLQGNAPDWPLQEEKTTNEPITAISARPARVAPDVHTYHILLNIAVLTSSSTSVRHATSLLLQSGIEPLSRTHAIMIPFYSSEGRLGSVRKTLFNMLESDESRVDVGAFNAVLWAYAKHGEMETAWELYLAMQSHTSLRRGSRFSSLAAENYETFVESLELSVPRRILPDVITYRSFAQALAYHGDLMGALRVFRDFIETPVSSHTSTIDDLHDDDETPRAFASAMPIYRAIFLGFARHATTPVATLVDARPGSLSERLANLADNTSAWNIENLERVFEMFLEQDPRLDVPSERVIFWLIVAIAKATGSNVRKMWLATQRVQKRFPSVRWRGRMQRFLDSVIYSVETGNTFESFPDDIVRRGERQRSEPVRHKS